MDQISDSHTDDAYTNLAARRVAKGYSLEDLAVATGLTIDEIDAAEAGNGSDYHIERIESVLR
jgi:transcriptional regulator with XRE-family HTH domain